MKWPSFTLIISGIFIANVLYSIWSLAQLFIPPKCVPGRKCLESLLKNDPKLQVFFFTSVAIKYKDVMKIDEWPNFKYKEPTKKVLSINIPQSTRNNGTLYLFVVIVPKQNVEWTYQKLLKDQNVMFLPIRLTEFHIPESSAYNLLGQNSNTRRSKSKFHIKSETHLKSRIVFSMMMDESLPLDNIPPDIVNVLRLNTFGQYLPPIKYDVLSYKTKELIHVTNQTLVDVSVEYTPISVGRFRFVRHIEATFEALLSYGFTYKDLDDIKEIFADTGIYLLSVMLFVSSLHLLFDFLSFKNDVKFWRTQRSIEGLSRRSVMWRAFSQAVIFLYLMEEKTSALVIIPSGISTVIEFWKLQKLVGIKFVKRKFFPWCPEFYFRGSSAAEQLTEQYDAEVMKYLSYFLYPLCIGGAVYSLFYVPHRSWYSWCINSLVNGVYAFGFIFMLPQLFINYKLKSVAHLPWRAFMYKAFNTFIDDVFAFLITMPTAHRVACFRDDLVFVIYLYQRWLYPVDKRRIECLESENQHIIKEKEN